MRIRDRFFLKGSTSAAIILIVVLTALVYASSLKNSFVWDDHHVIVNNNFIKSWKNFPLIFSKAYLISGPERDFYSGHNIGSGQLTYRPVITIFHFIDYSFWRLNAFGYHLTNLILHIFNAILLYFFIGLVVKDRRIGLVSSILFALHPVNSESVNVITFRGDLLVFLFFISSFFLFIRSDYYKGRKRLFYYIASILLFSLALFSKEMAITLPVLLMLYDYYFVFDGKLKKVLSHFKSRYIGYIAVSLIYLWIWSFPMGNINKMVIEYPGSNFYTNLLTISRVFATYIKWLFIPIDIHATLPYDSSLFLYSFFTPEALFSVLLVIACLVLAVALHRRSRIISFAILWFFIILLPVSNIVPISNIMASRYLYISTAGFCLLIAWLLRKLPTLKIFSVSPNILQRISKELLVVLLIFYSVFTIIRSFAWRNSATIWLEVAEAYPNHPLPRRNLGAWFKKSGLPDKAIDEFKIAISMDPTFTLAYNDLGVCYYEKGLFDEAIEEFKKALEFGLNWPDVYVNLGVCFTEKRQYQEAIGYFKQAIEIDPGCLQAYNNLGVTYAGMRNYAEAKKAWEMALEIDPEFKDARDNLKKLD